MKIGSGDAETPEGTGRRRSVQTDAVLLALVVGVIIAAAFFRSADRTDRGAPAEAGPAWTAGPEARRSPVPYAVPGVREDVKNDLRELATAQEVFFSDSLHYTADVALLEARLRLNLKAGSLIRIVWASETGWAAIAEGGRLGNASCVNWVGPVPESLRPRTRLQHRESQEGAPRCDGDP